LFTTKAKKNEETELFFDESKFTIHEYHGTFPSIWRSSLIIKDLKKQEIDLYHGLSNEVPFGIDKTGICSVVTIHDLIYKRFQSDYSVFDRTMYDLKFKYACNHADKIVAISNATKDDIIQSFKISSKKIEMIYQSCHEIFDQNVLEDELKSKTKYNLPEKYLLYVGSIIERKNLLGVIRAIKASNVPNLNLVVIGNGKKYKRKVEVLIEKHGMQNNVRFILSIPNAELSAIYKNAFAFIYPSFCEGFGIPVLEALMSRTPVITSNTTSLKEFDHPACFHFDPNDYSGMGVKIKELYHDKFWKDNKIFHAKYDGKKLSEDMINLYFSLV